MDMIARRFPPFSILNLPSSLLHPPSNLAFTAHLLQNAPHEQRPDGGVQRWGDRDHHHHHGAGDESPALDRPRRAAPARAGLSQLSAQLHLSGHLLEQSSSSAAGGAARQRRSAVGKSAFA